MSAGPCVLVVDDNAINLEICQEILEQEFTVFTASNAREAIQRAQQHQPQIVLLDVMLPGVDGLEICRRLRQLPEMRLARIIMVSAKAMLSERTAGMDAGADAYLTKPFDYDDLLAAIHGQAVAPRKP
ncbi:MAG TPA: response regulator [Pirellulales bacterium]|jgi:CheY-like chemotaxis protein|nr:response regulator [Pirellulales bacterium]HEX4144931.1 response regulator [Pirellulales bacterium]